MNRRGFFGRLGALIAGAFAVWLTPKPVKLDGRYRVYLDATACGNWVYTPHAGMIHVYPATPQNILLAERGLYPCLTKQQWLDGALGRTRHY